MLGLSKSKAFLTLSQMTKGVIAHNEQFLFFPTVLPKDLKCRHVKTRAVWEIPCDSKG